MTKNTFIRIPLILIALASFGTVALHAQSRAVTLPAAATEKATEAQTKASDAAEAGKQQGQAVSEKALQKNVQDQARALRGALAKADPETKAQLSNALKAMSSKAPVPALENLKALADSASLTPEQKTLATDLRTNAQSLILARNFNVNDPVIGGDVSQAINAIQQRDAKQALTSLSAISDKGKLTEGQAAILKNLTGDYGAMLQGAMGKSQQSIDTARTLMGM
jgi:hypothetical protein